MGSAWEEGIDSEIAFWRGQMDAIKGAREPNQTWRLARREFDKFYRDLVPAERQNTSLRVLDVGSGPFSHQGNLIDGKPFELICTDILADQYGLLLDEFELRVPVPTIKCSAEELSSLFAPNSFDLVTSTNALDHSENPVKAIGEMFKVCRPGGGIAIEITEDEGVHADYSGFHQANFRIEDGALIVWNPHGLRVNIDEVFANQIAATKKIVEDHPWRKTDWGKDYVLVHYTKA